MNARWTGLGKLVVGLFLLGVLCSSAAMASPVRLQYYSLAWQPGVVRAVRDVVAEWNDSHPDIQVEIVWGAWASANEFLLTSFLGGDAPDIFHQDAVMCYEYGVLGFAEPLTPYLDDELLSDIPQWMWDSASDYDGEIYGSPFLVETHAVFYNRRMFNDAGIVLPENASVTWQQIVDYAQQLTVRDSDGAVLTWGLLASVMEKFPWMLVAQNGGQIVHRNNDGSWSVSVDPAAREALRFYCDLVTEWQVMPPDAISSDYTYLMSGFSKDRYAMIIYGCWNRRILAQWEDVDWGIFHLEGPVQNITSGGPQAHGIWAGSEHKAEAAQFLDYISSAANVVEIAYPDWIFPARTSAQGDPRFGEVTYQWDLAKSWLPFAVDVLPRMPTIIAFDMRVIVPELENVMLGNKAFDEAMTSIEESGNAYLRSIGLQ